MTNVRSVGMLGIAAVVFVGGSILGTKLAFAPTKTVAATGDDPGQCVIKRIRKGHKVVATQVTVNVFNASERAGLAQDVANVLEQRGFIPGRVGNNFTNTDPTSVTIVTNNPHNPVVQLVAKQFNNKITWQRPNKPMPQGVNVLLGEGYNAIFDKAPTSIVADVDTEVCVPPLAVD